MLSHRGHWFRLAHGLLSPGIRAHRRLSDVGKRVGIRFLELLTLREKNSRREIKLNSMLMFVNTVVWKVRPGLQHLGFGEMGWTRPVLE